jgi:glycosyltransferase involved in cell wall biosynthesis
MLAYRLTDGLSQRTAAVSQAAARRFIALQAVPARKCVVISNAIEIPEFTPNAERRAQMRGEMNTGGEFVWLAAGRVAPAKDYPNLLRAFARVHTARPDARLWIAGAGSETALAPLYALASKVGLNGAVRWLGLRRDLAALLDAADGFVLASAWEGMPLALAEAMAMEKPVVATDVGGVRELAGHTGRLVAPKDAGALSEAMLAVMNLAAKESDAMGRKARERIKRRFNMEERAKEWERLYDGLK